MCIYMQHPPQAILSSLRIATIQSTSLQTHHTIVMNLIKWGIASPCDVLFPSVTRSGLPAGLANQPLQKHDGQVGVPVLFQPQAHSLELIVTLASLLHESGDSFGLATGTKGVRNCLTVYKDDLHFRLLRG